MPVFTVPLPEPEPKQVPFTLTHPAVSWIPFANVDEALVEVMLSAVDWMPAAKVEVAVVEVETR